MTGRRVTQKEALACARAIIDQYGIGAEFSAEDRATLSDLSGTELRYVVRRKNPKYPNDPRHLHVLAYDWTTPQQWSWLNAIKIHRSRDPDEAFKSRRRGKLLFALRYAIQPDLAEFRAAHPNQECAWCGNCNDLTTDHVSPTFLSIALEYLETSEEIELRSVQGCGDLIADIDVEAQWIVFHAARATYQILCRSCNARKGVA